MIYDSFHQSFHNFLFTSFFSLPFQLSPSILFIILIFCLTLSFFGKQYSLYQLIADYIRHFFIFLSVFLFLFLFMIFLFLVYEAITRRQYPFCSSNNSEHLSWQICWKGSSKDIIIMRHLGGGGAIGLTSIYNPFFPKYCKLLIDYLVRLWYAAE